MPLDDACMELEQIAGLIVEEHRLIHCMRHCEGEAPEPAAEAASLAAGISQVALMIRPLQLAAIDLELAASLAEA